MYKGQLVERGQFYCQPSRIYEVILITLSSVKIVNVYLLRI